MLRFALIGAAGYVAPRHMAAIQDLGHKLVAAFDVHDSVGILDRYSTDVEFFTQYERFERYLNKLYLQGDKIDYLVICSPNFLHDSHARLGLRLQADVICEKPVTLNERNLLSLIEAEERSNNKIWCILQARLHPEVLRLKNKIKKDSNERATVQIEYITPRGKWYNYSWKGDISKSGGVETNIGVHLFDLVCWTFGPFVDATCIYADDRCYRGTLTLKNADVSFNLSVNAEDLPFDQPKAHRVFKVNNDVYNLSSDFDTLHRNSYLNILAGQGFRLKDARPAIAIVEHLRKLRKN